MASSARDVIGRLSANTQDTPLSKFDSAIMNKDVEAISVNCKEALLSLNAELLPIMIKKMLKVIHSENDNKKLCAQITNLLMLVHKGKFGENTSVANESIEAYLREIAISDPASYQEIKEIIKHQLVQLSQLDKEIEEELEENAEAPASYWNMLSGGVKFFSQHFQNFKQAIVYYEDASDEDLFDSSPRNSPRQ